MSNQNIDKLKLAIDYMENMRFGVKCKKRNRRLYRVFRSLLIGFCFSESESFDFVKYVYNPKCTEPWDLDSKEDLELMRKVMRRAIRTPSSKRKGWLLEKMQTIALSGFKGRPRKFPALAPVQIFDTRTMLPKALGEWVQDLHDCNDFSLDYLAVGTVIGLSSLLGPSVKIYPKTQGRWNVVPNLWGILVGSPGVMKTPALQEVLEPMKQLEKKYRKAFSPTLNTHGRPSTNVEYTPEYIVGSCSVQKIIEMLSKNHNGLLVHYDEMNGFFHSLKMKSQEAARFFYLTSWGGNQSYDHHTLGRGANVVPHCCLSMVGTIQPGPLSGIVQQACKNGLGNDGMLDRFQILVWPNENKSNKLIDKEENEQLRKKAYAVYKAFAKIRDKTKQAKKPIKLKLDAEAFLVYKGWYESDYHFQIPEVRMVTENMLSKYRSLIVSLAAIFALANDIQCKSINAECMEMAIKWNRYLRSHMGRVFTSVLGGENSSAHSLARKIQNHEIRDESGNIRGNFTLREIYNNGWSGLKSKNQTEQAVKVLVKYNWLREIKIPSGKKHVQAFEVHPELMKNHFS
ncbi:DUF3987 domain-containing protein [Planctomycetota bacterium]|nr:DUF3987 domain-containing protein [Planctomycetota bacterium]